MINKTFSTLYDENKTVENFLIELFSWSKQFYKKQGFPKEWSYQQVKSKKELAIPLSCLNHGKIATAGSELIEKVKILDENKDIVALYKSEKIHSHPLSYGETDNVLSILLALGRADLVDINKQNYDRCMLFRLDYETSGLLLAAKSDVLYHEIRKNFSTMMMKKMYRLKCQGELKEIKKTWVHYLDAVGTSKHKIRVRSNFVSPEEQKQGQLSYEVLSYDKSCDVSEVLVSLDTGLRHQIRCQFAYEGHPIVGDELYGGRSAPRLFLHALEYQLRIEGKDMKFQAPLPIDWKFIPR